MIKALSLLERHQNHFQLWMSVLCSSSAGFSKIEVLGFGFQDCQFQL
jgi:hypothetical protein